MSLTDPVADLLARIRNAIHARHQKLDVPASNLKLEIARILKEEGYIANFKATEEEGRKVLRILPEVRAGQQCRNLQPASASRGPGAACTSGETTFPACSADWGSTSSPRPRA